MASVGMVGGSAFQASAPAPSRAARGVEGSSAPTRLAGHDRYATAAAVSALNFPHGAPIVLVATGADFPDALAAAAAGGGKGPLLLSLPGSLPAATAAELARLAPTRVTIVGGASAISDAAVAAVGAAVPGAQVRRLAGADRFATAAAVSAATFSAGVPLAYLATGTAYADALAAAAATGGRGPVLLSGGDGLARATSAELTRLAPGRVVVVGGTDAVPTSVKAAVEALLPATPVVRISGVDRYATAALVSERSFAAGAAVAYLATGADFPDALAAAAGAVGRGPVLLVHPDATPAAVAAEVARLSPARLYLVGGTEAVGDAAVAGLTAGPSASGPVVVGAGPVVAGAGPVVAPSGSAATPGPLTTTPGPLAAVLGPLATPGPPTVAPGLGAMPPGSGVAPGGGPDAAGSGAAAAVAMARAQLGKPYQWAGAGPDAFDCSGLTGYAWAAGGVYLPHNAAAQAEVLAPVIPDLSHLLPGDLVFFGSPIGHEGLYIGGGQMIEAAHAGVPVRIADFDRPELVGAGRPRPRA